MGECSTVEQKNFQCSRRTYSATEELTVQQNNLSEAEELAVKQKNLQCNREQLTVKQKKFSEADELTLLSKRVESAITRWLQSDVSTSRRANKMRSF